MKFKPYIKGIAITCDCGAAVVWTPGHLALWGHCSEKTGQELFEAAHERTVEFCGATFDHKGLAEWLDRVGGPNLALGVPFKMDDETREILRGQNVHAGMIDDSWEDGNE